ncbi:class I SAM-dependent methyltransferase [Pseudomonas saudiphocaensis]|uniref:class I SAM-dependent methyltransferase n=1 Tax=Pseudomonas saudiphocaensis TaxID=1499686 RepID=UPI00187D2F19|nr:class I SAM-dependent methyltransferase [Pseudomonas saudiphocaensis]MBE7927346.1 class I SAM-dependent methyltransferase [Pseudomonas saudiphocaensis]
MPDQWHMVQCTDCQSIWLNPRPDRLSLPRAYDSYYTHSEGGQSIPPGLPGKFVHGYLNERFAMHRKPAVWFGYIIFSLIEPWRLKLDYYGRHLTAHNREERQGVLLDIGCGNGEFLGLAREMGWNTLGCEIDPKAIALCQKKGLNVIEGDGFNPQLQKEYFAVITMSHVLEHVAHQPQLLQRTYELLKPGGHLWLALPNPESIGLRLYGESWREFHPPYHLNIPSQKRLKQWLKSAGYTDIKLIRRGAHASKAWKNSDSIAANQKTKAPNRIKKIISYIVANAIATISPRYAEETVITAKKPGGTHGD